MIIFVFVMFMFVIVIIKLIIKILFIEMLCIFWEIFNCNWIWIINFRIMYIFWFMFIRLLIIYLDFNLFNKDCLFKIKIKKNCNMKVFVLFFFIIVVVLLVNYFFLLSLCWLFGRFWCNFFERLFLFIGYFIVFI